jgi:hypothetical protein
VVTGLLRSPALVLPFIVPRKQDRSLQQVLAIPEETSQENNVSTNIHDPIQRIIVLWEV